LITNLATTITDGINH